MDRITEFFDLTVDLEGGFSNRANDRGGRTKYGITQHTLELYNNKHELVSDSIEDLTVEKAKTIYVEFYYNDIWYIEDEEIHFNCIDLAYNSGHKHYIEMWNTIRDNPSIDDIYVWRENYYKSLNQPANIHGWLNRLSRIKLYFQNKINS